MQCRHCNTGEIETQEHIETCTYFETQRGTLNLNKGEDKLIFWRKVIAVLKCLKLNNKDLFDHKLGVIDLINDATRSEAGSEEQVHTSPVLDGETRTRDREGLRTSAGVATSARDMSFGEGINDHPPKRSVSYWILK